MKNFRIRAFICCVLVLSMIAFTMAPVYAEGEKGSGTTLCCEVYVVSTQAGSGSGSSGGYGHSFIIVYNVSSSSIIVGHMAVPTGGSVTLGALGNRSTHYGIWYNIEGCYQISEISLCTALTQSELSTMNATINSGDYYNSLFHNCAHFAADVWNSVASSAYHISGGTPSALYTSINSKTGASTSFPNPIKTASDIAYQASSGVSYCPAGYYAH